MCFGRLSSRGRVKGSVTETAAHHKVWPAEQYHQQCSENGSCNGADTRVLQSNATTLSDVIADDLNLGVIILMNQMFQITVLHF